MNYARLPLEELEELIKQQGSWLQELEEALLNGRRAHNEMLRALNYRRVDTELGLSEWLGVRMDGGTTGAQLDRTISTNFAEFPPRVLTSWARQEREYRDKLAMINLINSVGDKYELL